MTKYDKNFISKLKMKLKIYKQLETDMTEAIRKHRDMKSILEDIRNNIFVYEDIIKTNEDN